MSARIESPTVVAADAAVTLIRGDAFEYLAGTPGASFECVITDCPYWTLDKHRAIGTTTRLGGHRDADKREGWFETIDRDELYTLLCESARVLTPNSHAWFLCDNEVQSVIQGQVREGETGFNYVKSYPVLKMTADGERLKPGLGYHLRATHEYAVLCEKGRRKFSDNNRPDFFALPWTGDAESRAHTPDGKPYPTAKPWMLYRWLLQLSTTPNERILDPFAGSGPLALAARVERRKAVLVDRSEYAIETIRRRMAVPALQFDVEADSGRSDGGD